METNVKASENSRTPTAAIRVTGVRPGPDLQMRVGPHAGFTAIARRDLGRYYALLDHVRDGMRGRFTTDELDALADHLTATPMLDLPEALAVVPHILLEAAERGLLDEGLAERVRQLTHAERWALVDAAEVVSSGTASWADLGMV